MDHRKKHLDAMPPDIRQQWQRTTAQIVRLQFAPHTRDDIRPVFRDAYASIGPIPESMAELGLCRASARDRIRAARRLCVDAARVIRSRRHRARTR